MNPQKMYPPEPHQYFRCCSATQYLVHVEIIQHEDVTILENVEESDSNEDIEIVELP